MGGSRSASSDGPAFPDLLLRPSQRPLLSRPLGPVLTEEKARGEIERRRSVSTCGDMVTATLVQWRLTPFVAVVDGKTLRDRPFPTERWAELTRGRTLRARNPPGEVTAELQLRLRELVRGGGGLLVVEGEEDLAVLPLARELPLGATLLYGQPGEGLCFLTLDNGVKERVTEILNGMEPRPT